jgi:hypothetical protein
VIRKSPAPRKLTAETARSIRIAAAQGASTSDLAAQYGVSPETIWDVVSYHTWVKAGGPRRESRED